MSRIPLVALAFALAGTSAFAQDAPNPAARCLTPDTVVVRGASRVRPEAILASSGIRPGQTLSFPAIQRAIRDVFATGDFDHVTVTCGLPRPGETGRVAFVLTVTERPLLGEIKVEGVERLSARAVEDRVELLLGRPVDPADIATAMRRIDSLYKASGYYLARVRPETTSLGDRIGLTFRVEEGRRLAISGILVRGNTALSAREVAKAMETRPEGFWWWRSGEFDEDTYAGDVGERIPKLFASHGYVDFQFERDTLVVDPALGKALIELDVFEGNQYRVKSFEVVGNRRFSAEQIGTLYPFRDRPPTITERTQALLKRRPPATDVFDRTRWEEATAEVRTLYNNDGYIYAQISPVVERDPADSGAVVRLRWDIREGSPAVINRIEILGNDFTVESCIRNQLLIIPGDVFNQDRLIQSWQGIGNLGFFETPLPFPDTRAANEAGDIDIVFRVKEKRTGNINFGASAGQGTGIGGFVGLDHPNLWGRCKRGAIQWQYGRYINDFNASYTDPGIRGTRISGQVSAYHSQARFRIANFGQTTRIGANVRAGFPFPNSRFTRVFTSYGVESVRFGNEGLLGTVTTNSCAGCVRSTLGVDVTRDTRVDLPFATEGRLQSFSAQFNGGPLGGSADFQRYTSELRSYVLLGRIGGTRPGTRPLRLTMGLTARSGAVFGDPGDFFWSQQFSLGGVQFGESLRGYPEFSITPSGYSTAAGTFNAQRESFGSAFFTSTAEVGLRFNQSLYVNAFYDAGNIWARARDFDPTRLFRGAGIGVSTVSPLGPLGLDYAYGFDRRDENGFLAPKWQLHFRLGQLF
ncbi:MAG: outer membrane protein assembly factor BamA [Gemmatimonadaceae bacterium]